MSEELVKQIHHLAKKCGENKVEILTNHLKISGELSGNENDHKNHEGFLTLSKAKMWRLEDICNCDSPNCKCNEANFCSLEWIHVNVYKVVAFSIV